MQLFADSQAHFAAVSEDGRLKVWDVDSGALQQELKERDHLSYRYTCLAWSQSSSSSSKSKKRSGASGLGLLALGTSSGQVVVWDLATQEVKHTLQTDGSSAAVQALAFNPQGSLLYSSSSDKYVLEWNLSSAQVERKFRCGTGGASALAVSEDGEVLAAGGSALRTFDLSSGKKSRKLVSGLSSAVTQLKFAAVDGLEASRFLFAATAGARFVNMYDLQLTEVDAPALTFSLPSSAEGLFARASAGEAVALKKSKKSKKSKKDKTEAKPVVDLLVGVTAPAGAMFLWAHKYEQVNDTAELALASKPLPPTLSTAESAGILLAELSTQEDKDQKTEVLVARGSLVKPVFEKVSVVEENAPSQWKKELEFAEISDALLLSAERDEAASKNGSKRQKVEATPADEKTHVPTLSERRALTNSMAVVDETTSFEELNGEEEEEEDNELTLAERVEALRERVESDVSGAISRAERAAEAPEDKTRGDKPDASSLASVLEQALQARDNALLEYCLSARDAKVVVRTVARVSPSRVLALLDVIVKKLERSPNRFARLCPWLRAVLLHHTAYLVAQPDLVPSLSALYQLLESRLQVHSEMQKLAGRLALVLGQIHVNNANNEQEDEETRAAVVYHEGEEEVEAKAEEEIDAEDESEEEEEEEDDDDDGEDEDEDVDVESEDE